MKKTAYSIIQKHMTSVMYLKALVLLALAACGKKNPEINNLREPDFIEITQINDRYFLQDFDCQYQNDKIPISLAYPQVWNQNLLKTSSLLFDDTFSLESLKSPYVLTTKYARHFIRKCENNRGIEVGTCLTEKNLPNDTFELDSGSVNSGLKICRNNFQYHVDSFEGVALTAVHHINSAYKNYKILSNPKLPQLSPVDLEILPRFETTWRASADSSSSNPISLTVANNLSFFPAAQQFAPKIIVFPENKSTQNNEQRYWASGFAVAHELGHHFHTSIENRYASRLGLFSMDWSPIQHKVIVTRLKHPHGFNSVESISSTQFDNIGFSTQDLGFYLSSFYEATADLFAFYILDRDDSSLVGLTMLNPHRRVSSPNFNTQRLKVLDATAVRNIRLYLGGNDCEDIYSCSFHNVGAIHAHAFEVITNKLLTDRYRDRFSLLTETQKKSLRLELLMVWFQNIYRVVSQGTTTTKESASLSQPIHDFIRTALIEAYAQVEIRAENLLSSTTTNTSSKLAKQLDSKLTCADLETFYPGYQVSSTQSCSRK